MIVRVNEDMPEGKHLGDIVRGFKKKHGIIFVISKMLRIFVVKITTER